MYYCTSFHAFLFTRPKSGSWRAGLGAAAVRTPRSRPRGRSPGPAFCSTELSVTGAPHARETAARGCLCCCCPLTASTCPRRRRSVRSDQDLPATCQMQLVRGLRCVRGRSFSPLPGSSEIPGRPLRGSEVGSKLVRDSASLIIEQIFISHLLCGLGWPRC